MPDRQESAPTFRRRLTVSMTVLAVAILTVASAAIYLQVRQALLSHIDSALLSLARMEMASAFDEPGGKVHVHEDPLLTAGGGSGYEKFAEIRDATHRIRAQTSNLSAGPPLEVDPERERRAFAGEVSIGGAQRGHHPYRAIYYPMRDTNGDPLVAVVAIPDQPVRRTLDSLLGALALALIVGGAGAGIAASRLARRLTRPLEQVAASIGAIDVANLQSRIPDVSRDAELSQMTRVLNAMLERLDAAFAAQRSFVADASHELRSPLANLRGTLEVALRRRRSPEEYREALSVALTEAERLSRLVDELLMLARVDARQLILDRRPCDLSDIAHDAVTALAARAREQNVQLRLDTRPAGVTGDAHRLRQAVDNLLANALRYAPVGSEVAVTTRQDDGRGVLTVKDSGPGLSAEERAHVFDRFYRVDAARARDSGGLGLGLAIAQAIVGAHRGEISVHSRPGEGCMFRVVLPVT